MKENQAGEGLAWLMRVNLTRYPFARRQLWMLTWVLGILLFPLWLFVSLQGMGWVVPLWLGGIIVAILVLINVVVFRAARNSLQYYCLDGEGVTALGLKANPERDQLVGSVLRTAGILAGAGSAVAAGSKLGERHTFQRFMAWNQVRAVVLYPGDRALTVHRGLSFISVALFCPDEDTFQRALEEIRRNAPSARVLER